MRKSLNGINQKLRLFKILMQKKVSNKKGIYWIQKILTSQKLRSALYTEDPAETEFSKTEINRI